MDEHKLSIFFRISIVIAVLSIVCVAITTVGTPEFIVSILSLAISVTVAVLCGVCVFKKRNR